MKKKIVIAAGSVFALVVGFWTFVEVKNASAKNTVYEIEVADIQIPSDEASIASGCRVVRIHTACTLCHGEDFGGGTPIPPAFATGAIHGPNITRAGVTRDYAPADWVRALRHGVKPNGLPLVFMPAHEFTHLSDAELGQAAACLLSLDPVDRTMPPTSAGPVLRAMYALGAMDLYSAEIIDHQSVRPHVAPPVTDQLAFGEHLTMSCRGCHGHNFSGGPIPGVPPSFPEAANLTPHDTGLGTYDKADFVRALREAKKKDGSAIDPFMPVQLTKQLDDAELDAMWAYLQTVPPAAYAKHAAPSS